MKQATHGNKNKQTRIQQKLSIKHYYWKRKNGQHQSQKKTQKNDGELSRVRIYNNNNNNILFGKSTIEA